ncbi:Hypothetical protein I595_3425 [Croceitalea dokdonensis DOKDO 023]|uniref:Uncharacterized protein n=1 Tax=Croceitalea dokdonensis DOKDO 023 TaxID=1300341 RepID=A0A0N8H3F2_9FLAO|nr:hypothetical protein [Croceitalea dokdonensis]KPM30404.1 Hypothetical protein I595_3425 [Croceitalea dokdonensis DOKDO 023]
MEIIKAMNRGLNKLQTEKLFENGIALEAYHLLFKVFIRVVGQKFTVND